LLISDQNANSPTISDIAQAARNSNSPASPS